MGMQLRSNRYDVFIISFASTSVLTDSVPSGTSQLSSCPLEKDQMSTGEWTILVIGNNGDGNPFAYERDFSLTVG